MTFAAIGATAALSAGDDQTTDIDDRRSVPVRIGSSFDIDAIATPPTTEAAVPTGPKRFLPPGDASACAASPQQ